MSLPPSAIGDLSGFLEASPVPQRQIEDIRRRIRQQAAQLEEEAQDIQLFRYAPKPLPRFSVQNATAALPSAMRAPFVTSKPQAGFNSNLYLEMKP